MTTRSCAIGCRPKRLDLPRFATHWLVGALVSALLLACVAAAEAGDSQAPAPRQAEPVVAEAEPVRRGTPSWYAATVAEDEKGGFLMVHFWSKGPLFRSEAIIAGRRIETLVDRTTYYIIDSASGTGVAIERSAAAIAQDEGRVRPFANELHKLLMEGGELVGSETSAQGPVEVYRVTNSRGQRTLWMSIEDPQVPLRVRTYDRATATTGKVDYVNWLYGPKIWDGFFAPDPRIDLERISYEQYRERVGRGPIGPAPVLYSHLLHGEN
jgi:hypothetical protein